MGENIGAGAAKAGWEGQLFRNPGDSCQSSNYIAARILYNPFTASCFGGDFLYGQRIQQLFLRSLG
jgi:hypothetical protein